MSIAVIGADGQLGRELRQRLQDEAVVPLSHREIEITDPQRIETALDNVQPDLVVNAAAYNRVDAAEDDPETAYAVNALGPRNLALYCRSRDLPLVHVSSDYVFSGRVCIGRQGIARSMPYRETDRAEPLSAYGVSKLAGELFVRALCSRHFVLRTCGLYGPTPVKGTGNFVQRMLGLAEQGGPLRVVDDQRCTPTSTADLAEAVHRLIGTEAYGLYHATNRGSTTWYGFAREIFRLAGIDADLQPIGSAEYGAKATRPCYSVLDCEKLEGTAGFQMPPWQTALKSYLDGLA